MVSSRVVVSFKSDAEESRSRVEVMERLSVIVVPFGGVLSFKRRLLMSFFCPTVIPDTLQNRPPSHHFQVRTLSPLPH